MCVLACVGKGNSRATKCQTQMSPISHWQSMEIYRKLRTNKILRLFAFSFTTPARSNLSPHPTILCSFPLSLSCFFGSCLARFLGLLKCIFLTAARQSAFFSSRIKQNVLHCSNSCFALRQLAATPPFVTPTHVAASTHTSTLQAVNVNVYDCRFPFQLIEMHTNTLTHTQTHGHTHTGTHTVAHTKAKLLACS